MVKIRSLYKRSFGWVTRRIYKGKLFFKFGFNKRYTVGQLTNKSTKKTYEYFNYLFHFGVPKSLKYHRHYFQLNQRGFGEDAFHSAWFEIFRTYRPRKSLEIGVYRGQTISLWALCAQQLSIRNPEIWGLTPLRNLGDSKSHYLEIDYRSDINSNFEYFSLPLPNILESKSESQVAKKFIKNGLWNLIYIDGGHDYETVLSDYIVSRDGLCSGGILVLDDSSLYLNYKPGKSSFAGHPGPSKVLKEFALKELNHFLTVGHLNFFKKS